MLVSCDITTLNVSLETAVEVAVINDIGQWPSDTGRALHVRDRCRRRWTAAMDVVRHLVQHNAYQAHT